MTEQTEQTESKKGYNLKVTPKGEINTAPTSTGTKKIRFRGTCEISGKLRERTFVAMGKAADEVDGKIVAGQEVTIRGLFANMFANDDGKKGGQYVNIIGLPHAKAA